MTEIKMQMDEHLNKVLRDVCFHVEIRASQTLFDIVRSHIHRTIRTYWSAFETLLREI